MTLLPRSLYGRLLALSTLITGLALVVAAFGIGHVLERFVTSTLDERLSDKLSALSGAVRKDGTLDRAYIQRFDTFGPRDADWRVDAPGGSVGSAMIDGSWGISFATDQSLPPIERTWLVHRDHYPGPPPPPDDALGDDGAWPFDLRLASGERVHGRAETVPTNRGPALIAVAMPRAMIDRPTRAILAPLSLSLLLLGSALAAATLVQLRIGLRPLRGLRAAIAEVRHGRAEHLPADQPTELQPLVTELNALLDENAVALVNARGHAANLAHALKTPLAKLMLGLRAAGRDPDGAMTAEVDRIDRAVRHHLGRARAAAPGGPARVATPLAPVVDDLVAALGRIHVERGIAASTTIDLGLSVAVDRQDLDELIGNLLDNAWRWAAAHIAVTATPANRVIRLTIEDDGPGIRATERAAAIRPGQRLDERGDGHGFGLSIARELVELYGGTLALDSAMSGGLRVIVTLPMSHLSD